MIEIRALLIVNLFFGYARLLSMFKHFAVSAYHQVFFFTLFPVTSWWFTRFVTCEQLRTYRV